MSDLLERVVAPVASVEDAEATCRALSNHDHGHVTAIHVIEKAGGAPDKAGVEQRELEAEKMFAVVEAMLDGAETEIRFGTDVSETIFDAAADHDASAIVITPRGGSRWVRMLTGDVALDLVTDTDRPVVVLPDISGEADDGSENDIAVDDGDDGAPDDGDNAPEDRDDDTAGGAGE